MSLAFWMTLRTLRGRLGALLITVAAVALATATALSVPLMTRQVERGAQDAAQVFDLLIAAPGSGTQAVMSSLFYLDAPTGNVPRRVYEDLRTLPGTRRAVPVALGDSHHGLPIVGTTKAFFDQRLKPSAPPYFKVARGRLFASVRGEAAEVVVGARAAKDAGLTLGSTFHGTHGLEEPAGEAEGEHGHEGEYVVVGLLAPTGGPVDRAILTSVEAVWAEHPDAEQDVTAVLYSAENLAGIYQVAGRVNAGRDAMAVFPGQVFAQARNVLLQGQAAYAGLSFLVLGIAALTVWLGVHAATVERQRTVALLRALGAGRPTVAGLVLTEALLTVGLGVVVGLGAALVVSGVGGAVLGQALGFAVVPPELTWPLATRALALIPVGVLAAVPAAWQAMRVSPLTFL